MVIFSFTILVYILRFKGGVISEKLYRTTNKVSSGKHYYSCCEDQPWYGKSYEKNKFSKKVWRNGQIVLVWT